MKPSALGYILTCTMLLTNIVGCRKDSNSTTSSTSNHNLLSEYYTLDTTKIAPFDTTLMLRCTYDSQGRIQAYSMMLRDTGSNYTISDTGYQSFLYQANDTLPYEGQTIGAYSLTHIPLINYYQFNNAGLLVYDSSPGSSISTKYWYTIFNTKVLDSSRSGTGPLYFAFTSYPTIQNGNIVAQVDSLPGDEVLDQTYVLDTKPNPFYKVFLPHIPAYYPTDFSGNNEEAPFLHLGNVKNNCTSMLYTDSTFPASPHSLVEEVAQQRTYQYNPNGYPSFVWLYDPVHPSRPIQKGIYLYK